MKPLKACWPALERRVASGIPLAVLLDYDGTLVPIADHPAHAILSAGTRRLLERLVRQRGLWILLVSGRALSNLKRTVRVRGAGYVGNHGLELEGYRLRYVNAAAQAHRPVMRTVGRELTAALRAIPGAWVEDKQLTLSLHWRAVPRSAQGRFRRIAAGVMAPYLKRGAVRVTDGKRVIEIRPPVRWGKGKLVAWLRPRLAPARSGPRPFLIYMGDDQTDEGAFRAVNRYRGMSVLVGRRRPTSARWWLRHPLDVKETLERILRGRCKSPRIRSPHQGR